MNNQVAIITGGASQRGIGWATAKRFAEEGARVAILGLDAEAAKAAAAEIGSAHLGYPCDVRSEAACQAVVQQILSDFRQIDVLVNNAGVSQAYSLLDSTQAHRLLDSTQADYDLVMDVSVRAAYNMSRSVVPHLRARWTGSIVCMGSVSALRGGGVLGGPHYAGAKDAVHSMAKAMARELAPDGIRVNAVVRGLVETELLVGKMTDAGKQKVAETTPLGRLAQPLEIANACLFLASSLSSYVTEIVLDVNGGLHIH